MGFRLRPTFTAGALLIGLSFATANAAAYCRSRTCRDDLETGSFCRREGACIAEGFELFRRSSCASYSVNEERPPALDLSPEDFDRLVNQAFDRWLTADCGGGRHPSLNVESFGIVSCDEASYNKDSGNVNVFVFRDDWSLFDVNAFALTIVSFEESTGEIYDVDVEINGTVPNLVIDDPSGGVDLSSILTHEVGHFLGLAHSEDVIDAVPSFETLPIMRPYYRPYEDDLTRLRPDDIAGICAVYPPGRETESDSCFPRHGFASACRFEPLEARGGCGFAPAATRSGALLGALASALLGMRLRTLRRRREP